MKRVSRAQQRIDTKLLCNQCGFAKTIFNRKQQDTHTCPVCNGPKEDRNDMFFCKGLIAVSKRKKKLSGFKKMLEELGPAPILTKVITGCLRHVYNGTTPSVNSFGQTYFGGSISPRGIMKDQADIGWSNFLCGRWSLKRKEAQKRHDLQMNKRKSARLWTIAILEKLLLIRWDMW